MKVNRNTLDPSAQKLCDLIEEKNPRFFTKNLYILNEEAIFKEFAQYLSEEEAFIIELLIQNEQKEVILGEAELQLLEQLNQTEVVQPISPVMYFIDNDFLNLYNHFILNDRYPKRPLLSSKEAQSIGEAVQKQRMGRHYQKLSFSEALDAYFSVDMLKDICRGFGLKGFSKGKKSDIIHLIEKAFKDDSDSFLDTFLPDELSLLAQFVLLDTNCIPIKQAGELSLNAFIINTNQPFDTLVFMPPEYLDTAKGYFEKKHLDPLDFIPAAQRDEIAETSKNIRFERLMPLPTDSPAIKVNKLEKIGKDATMRKRFLANNEVNGMKHSEKVRKLILKALDGKVKNPNQWNQELQHQLQIGDSQVSSSNIIDFSHYRK